MQKKKLNKKHAKIAKKNSEPFLLLDSDPANFGDDFPPRKRVLFNSKNPRKSLTIPKMGSIIKGVNKLKRKDDKMASDKTKKSNKANGLKSLAWLAFAAQQAFIGYVLLSNFDNYAVVACALLSLGLAGVVVIAHFFNAHK